MKHLLRDEIRSEFENLSRMEIGTEEYKVAVDGLTKLMDREIELEKHEAEVEYKIDSRNIDNRFKARQMEEDRKDRLIKNILAAVGIAIPAGLTIWGTVKSIEFEKEGTITTIMGRGFIQKLLPKK